MFEINCPSCGNPVRFRRESSLYSVCDACHSILLRHDVNVDLIGKAADLQPDESPLQIGARGRFRGAPFEVVGRIQTRNEDGFWNEWYIEMPSGNAWLGEALGEYFISEIFDSSKTTIRKFEEYRVGDSVQIDKYFFTVSNKGQSTVVSYEGELPFIMTGSYNLPYIDLRSSTNKAATIDYSEDPPLLFVGEYADFRALAMTGLRDREDMVGQRSAMQTGTKTVKCPGCGASHELSGRISAQTFVCQYCGTAMDLKDPSASALMRNQQNLDKIRLDIPLGSKGKIEDTEWEVIGFVRKRTKSEGRYYYWNEYLCYSAANNNYRYLCETNGHWTWVATTHSSASYDSNGRQAASIHNYSRSIWLEGRQYQHFQTYEGEVHAILGEFPYKAVVGAKSRIADYTAPPRCASAEEDAEGLYWSVGCHIDADSLWKAFNLPGSPPKQRGNGMCQPNPYSANNTFAWSTFLLFAMLLLFTYGFLTMQASTICKESHDVYTNTEASALTKPFKVPRVTNLTVDIKTDFNNQWAYFEAALINEDTQEARCFGKNIEYWCGSDWSEGSREGSFIVSHVKPGNYVLRIEPAEGGNISTVPYKFGVVNPKEPKQKLFNYTVQVHKSATYGAFFLVAFFMFLVPPIITLIMSTSFESTRWEDSDHPRSSDDDD